MQEILHSLKPTSKSLIIDVVDNAGIDVTAWRASYPANPRYCYQWTFASADRQHILFCLWYDDCVIEGDTLQQTGNYRDYITQLEADGGPQAGRAREVDERLQDAWRLKVSVRVAIVDETQKRKAQKVEGEDSEAQYRELDPEPWHLKHYDMKTGDYVIVRGAHPKERELTSGDGGKDFSHLDEQLAAGDDGKGSSSSSSEELVEDLLTQAARTDVPETTRNALIKARIGQGSFRAALIRMWGGQCAATSCTELAVLRASHIKPWRSSDDTERLDPANGLLLMANLDALFDQGFISFSDSGRMLMAKALMRQTQMDMGLPVHLRQPLSERQRRYLKFHREELFKPG